MLLRAVDKRKMIAGQWLNAQYLKLKTITPLKQSCTIDMSQFSKYMQRQNAEQNVLRKEKLLSIIESCNI